MTNINTFLIISQAQQTTLTHTGSGEMISGIFTEKPREERTKKAKVGGPKPEKAGTVGYDHRTREMLMNTVVLA